PAPHHLQHRQQHAWIVVVEVWLMREEAVPIVGTGGRIPSPVRLLRVAEDDTGAGVTLVGIAPNIPVAGIRAPRAGAGRGKPAMVVGGVIDHELCDDPKFPSPRLLHEATEVLHGPEVRVDVPVVRDVIAVVTLRRWVEREQPQRRYAKVLQVVELFGEPG